MRADREHGQGDTPRRRALRRSAGSALPRTDSERIAAVAAEADVPVEEVLKDVADFRLALETDMIIAAAAVDAENPELLSEMIDGERLELATFHDRLMERLADAAADNELASRRARREARPRRLPRLIITAAAALALIGAGRAMVTPTDIATTPAAAMESADRRYADFSSAVTSDSPVAVRKAAKELHDSLEQLIADHANDPEAAERAAQLLQAEISLLRANDPDGASHVLAQARSLVSMLERRAPKKIREVVQPVLDAAGEPEKPKKATPSPKPSPAAKATSSPKPSPSPKPSGEPNPLHTP